MRSCTGSTYTCWRGRSMGQIFDHRETVMGAALAGAHSLRESRGAMARRGRLLFDLNAVAYTQSTNTVSMRSPKCKSHLLTVTSLSSLMRRRPGVCPVSDVCLCMLSTCRFPCTALTRPCMSASRHVQQIRWHRRSRDGETLGEVAQHTAQQMIAGAV